MLAIPIDSKNDTKISELYGNAPFFALLDTVKKSVEIVSNVEIGKGPKIAKFLKSEGADGTIFYHMGEGVYASFEKEGMDVYKATSLQMSIDDIIKGIQNSELMKLHSDNASSLLDPGESATCKCGCE